MAKRTGATELQKVARTMCRLIVVWSPAIRKLADNNPAVILALETAMGACAVLEQELSALTPMGE